MTDAGGAAIPDQEALPVVDEADERRFSVRLGEDVAELGYRRRGDRLLLIHTEVPPAFEGRGIGGLLVRHAVGQAREEGLTVMPYCRFANAWLRRHPDVARTVEIVWPPDEELS
jgi:predicted GNAT family acetyltransferase